MLHRVPNLEEGHLSKICKPELVNRGKKKRRMNSKNHDFKSCLSAWSIE